MYAVVRTKLRTLLQSQRRRMANVSSVVVNSLVVLLLCAGAAYALAYVGGSSVTYQRVVAEIDEVLPSIKEKETVWPAPLDTKEYNERMLALAHYTPPLDTAATSTATSTPQPPQPYSTDEASVSVPGRTWPAPAAYPHGDALLPFYRIIAYYGNFYSTRMGVLGEYPVEVVKEKLKSEVDKWTAADPNTPAIPAIHYIVTVAQADAGPRGLYRARMPDEEIDKALALAEEVGGVLFLDIQVGKSTLAEELPAIEQYLKLPNVHLGLDPEFSMKSGHAPGKVIGTFDAADINYAAEYLAELVNEHQLPPKVLVIHRFTQKMLTNYQNITPLPEVQMVIDMDGWGEPEKKKGTYNHVVAPEPVQFTGIKIFYGNDLKAPSTRLLSVDEVLNLDPVPVYIQYQ